jgi:hypothetical protein
MKERTIFDVLNSIYYKTGMDYEKKIVSAYVLSLWLSHDTSLIEMVNDVNMILFNLEDEWVYKYYYNKIPKGRRYIKWPRKSEKDKEKGEKIKSLMLEFGVSKREAEKCMVEFAKSARK